MERVFAEINIGDPTVFSPAGTFNTFGDIVNVIVKNAFMLAGVITFILLIFGGISIIVGAGSGDTKKLEQGKKSVRLDKVTEVLNYFGYEVAPVLKNKELLPFEEGYR